MLQRQKVSVQRQRASESGTEVQSDPSHMLHGSSRPHPWFKELSQPSGKKRAGEVDHAWDSGP